MAGEEERGGGRDSSRRESSRRESSSERQQRDSSSSTAVVTFDEVSPAPPRESGSDGSGSMRNSRETRRRLFFGGTRSLRSQKSGELRIKRQNQLRTVMKTGMILGVIACICFLLDTFVLECPSSPLHSLWHLLLSYAILTWSCIIRVQRGQYCGFSTRLKAGIRYAAHGSA